MALLLGAYTWRTIDRNWDWEDEERLFRAALKARPGMLPSYEPSFGHHGTTDRTGRCQVGGLERRHAKVFMACKCVCMQESSKGRSERTTGVYQQ